MTEDDQRYLAEKWPAAVAELERLASRMKELATPYAEWLVAADPERILNETLEAHRYLVASRYYDVEFRLDIEEGTRVRLVRDHRGGEEVFTIPLTWATDRAGHEADIHAQIAMVHQQRAERLAKQEQSEAEAERAEYERLKAKFEGDS